MITNIPPIDQIKTLVESESLSFLIGAGFGKNISTVFPFWKELLTDAILEKYGLDKEPELNQKEEALVNKVIREHGLLGVASKIVSDAGFHEAVDDYIEQHTPYLDLAEDGSVVLKKAGKELADKVSLDCHQLLRQLNIKNIYTFNYDNALEFCLGDKRILSKEKAELEGDLRKTEYERRLLQDEYSIFLQEAERTKNGLSALTREGESRGDLKSVEVNKDQEKKNSEYLERLKRLDAKVFNLTSRLKEIQKKLDDSYLVISRSSDIAQTDDGRNIYKIHGSLRLSQEEDYGFDGDKHAHYIITREDYESYERKHGAFVNLMRIDLLRKRFCIVGVSGGDANFLAWIGWVKDVLDKTGNEDGLQQKHSFFVYAGTDDLSRDMKQMLENHFIIPVILKDYFPNADDDTERVKLFLEYIQPSINNTTKMVKLWKDVDRASLEQGRSFSMDKVALRQLCELSKKNMFFKPSSPVHYATVTVEDSSYRYLKDADDDKLKVMIAAARCSLLPVGPSLLAQMKTASTKSKDTYIKEGLGYVTRRQKLLYAPQTLTRAEMVGDGYTAILKRLYLYDFPSEKECAFTCETGLDRIRLYSLQRMLFSRSKIDLREDNIVSMFANPQELTLVSDWLNWLERDLESPIKEAAKKYRENYKTYHLSEYVEAYLKEMREKKEPDPYGNITETIYLDGRLFGYENAAVLLNSLIEMGVTFAGHTVLTDKDWVDLVHELMPYHPYPMVFYTIARGSKESVIKRVAQELMYDGHSYTIASDILKRLLKALCNENVPGWMMGTMSQFARCLFVAVSVSKWGKPFKEIIIPCLDYADKKAEYNTQKALYGMVSAGVEYIRDKRMKLMLLKRVLESHITEKTDNYLNLIAIAAKEGVATRDFAPLAELLVGFAQKKRGRLQSYILINLSPLLGRDDMLMVCDVLEAQALRDNQLAVPYAYLIRLVREKALAFKAKIAAREDVWQSGISGSGARMGGSHVRVSQVDKILHFDGRQVSHIWDDMVLTLKKVNDRLDHSRNPIMDQGMLSSENTYREMVMDMQLFVHNHANQLQSKQNYEDVVADLEQTYNRCCFGKTILQMISDDEMYRAIRGMMIRTEIDGIESLTAEYKALVSCLLAKESISVNHLFLHLSWVMKEHKEFFGQQEFLSLFMAILDSFEKYFGTDRLPERWDICGCEKEKAESCLMEISKVLNDWGYRHPFWTRYEKQFFVK